VEAAEDAVLHTARLELLEHGLARPVGASDRAEDELRRLGGLEDEAAGAVLAEVLQVSVFEPEDAPDAVPTELGELVEGLRRPDSGSSAAPPSSAPRLS
jgi:hypothetical protein